MSDIICFEIANINRSGITVKSGKTDIKICFDECVKNYANEKSLKTSRCVAARDITKLTFTFYTHPNIRVVFKMHTQITIHSNTAVILRYRDGVLLCIQPLLRS